MKTVAVVSTTTAGLQPTSASTLTTAVAIGTATDRVAVCHLIWAGGSGQANTPVTAPTLGGVSMSIVTRPQGGTNVFQSSNWILPISDGSTGPLNWLIFKSAAGDGMMGIMNILSGASASGYSSVVSVNLSAGPAALAAMMAPAHPNEDMVFGFMANDSATTNAHTQTGEGTPVISSVTLGGSASGIYAPIMSLVTQQGDSSVSLAWTLAASGRWRLQGLVVSAATDDPAPPAGGGSAGWATNVLAAGAQAGWASKLTPVAWVK